MIIWLASYPKSGNTWVRFFITSLLLNTKDFSLKDSTKLIGQFPMKRHYDNLGININFNNLNEVSKYWLEAQKKINSDNKIRIFKTHNALCNLNDNFFSHPSLMLGAIHVIRDPRNIITSIKNYYGFKNINDTLKFLIKENNSIFPQIENKNNFALPQLIGSWKEHYHSWKQVKKNYLLVKYEQLIDNSFLEFKKIADYIGSIINRNFSDDQINTAIKLTDFKRLQNLEKKYGFQEAPKNQESNKRRNFFYLGENNNWKKILDQKTTYRIIKEFKKEMEALNYI